MKTVSARIAIIEQQMGVTISDDRKKLEGFLFANLLNDIFEAGHMDVTYERFTDNIGTCDKDKYHGAYEMLFENRSDVSLFMLSNVNCDRMSPFEISRVVIDHSNDILMMRKLEQSQVRVSSLLGSTPPSIGLILFAFLITILIGILISRHVRVQRLRLRRGESTKTSTKPHLFPMLTLLVGVSMRQGLMIRSKSSIARSFFYLFCWLALMFLVFFSSDFKTDLMIKKPVETIESLEKLAASDQYRALFPIEWNLWMRFSGSDDPILKSIWMKATHGTGRPEDGTISIAGQKGKIDPFEMLQRMRQGNVFISDRNINRFLVNAYCLGYDVDNKENINEIVYQSMQSFFPSLLMGIMRKDAPVEVKNRYNFILTCFNEHGFHDFYVQNPLGILRKTTEQKNCFHRMRLETIGDGSEQDVRPIIWGNISRLVVYCSMILATAVLALAIEWTRSLILLRRQRATIGIQ